MAFMADPIPADKNRPRASCQQGKEEKEGMKCKINNERQVSGTRWAAGRLVDPRRCWLPWVLIWGKVSNGVILPPSLGDTGENPFAGVLKRESKSYSPFPR